MKRVLVMMGWVLVPFWAKDASMGYKLINAKAETLSTKASFKTPFKKKRCLVLADEEMISYETTRNNTDTLAHENLLTGDIFTLHQGWHFPFVFTLNIYSIFYHFSISDIIFDELNDLSSNINIRCFFNPL